MPKVYRSEQFNFRDGSFSTCASDLGLTAKKMSEGVTVDDRIFKDALDTGFAIMSKKTGKLAVYVRKNVDTKDGDLRAWEFEAVQYHPEMFWPRNDVANFNAYKDTKVTIFND